MLLFFCNVRICVCFFLVIVLFFLFSIYYIIYSFFAFFCNVRIYVFFLYIYFLIFLSFHIIYSFLYFFTCKYFSVPERKFKFVPSPYEFAVIGMSTSPVFTRLQRGLYSSPILVSSNV